MVGWSKNKSNGSEEGYDIEGLAGICDRESTALVAKWRGRS